MDISYGNFGIDVSRWQGNIDWATVAQSTNIAIIKASGADDGFYTDSMFHGNYDGAKSVGIRVGAYHFFTEYEDPISQAEYFASLLNGKQWDIRPVIDVESGIGDSALTIKVLTFCARVKEITGMDCIIYCNSNYANNAFDNRITVYPLWIASYGVNEPDTGLWSEWVGFQYSSDEYLNGISDNSVDKNKFTDGIFNPVAQPIQPVQENNNIEKVEEEMKIRTFSRTFYMDTYPDVRESGIDPWIHYQTFGVKEGRQPLPNIPEGYTDAGYLICNADVAQAINQGIFCSGLDHFYEFGWRENRNFTYTPVNVMSQDEVNKRVSDMIAGLKAQISNIENLIK